MKTCAPFPLVTLTVLMALASGCTNRYAEHYVGLLDGKTIEETGFLDVARDEPRLYRSDDLNADAVNVAEDGYWPIGYASFLAAAGSGSRDDALEQARSVGAEIVLLQSEYLTTEIDLRPVTVPHYHTFRSKGESVTTTSYSTEWVPYSVDRHTFEGLFFAPIRRDMRPSGILAMDVPREVAREIGQYQGAWVYAVMKDSPARAANVMAGDVVVEIDGQSVDGPDDFNRRISRVVGGGGGTATLTIVRDGQRRPIPVRF